MSSTAIKGWRYDKHDANCLRFAASKLLEDSDANDYAWLWQVNHFWPHARQSDKPDALKKHRCTREEAQQIQAKVTEMLWEMGL